MVASLAEDGFGRTRWSSQESEDESNTAIITRDDAIFASLNGGVDDFPDNNATTGQVVPGFPATGNIEISGDRDWFRVELQAGATYAFNLLGSATSDGTLPDPVLRLINSEGVVLTADDDSGTGLNALIASFTAPTRGVYFLDAASARTADTGTYRLSAQLLSSGPDDFAANTATDGRITAGFSTFGSLEVVADRDWFRVELQAGATYRFDLLGRATADGTLNDPLLRLRSDTGTVLASDDDAGTGLNARIASFTAPARGVYYLEAADAVDSVTGSYRLTATLLTDGPDDFAANTATAGRITAGFSTFGSVEVALDRDWYRVELQAGATYRFDLLGGATSDGTLPDPVLRLLNSEGVLLTADDDSGTGLNALIASFTAPTRGVYFLDAASARAGETGTYRLTTQLLSNGPDDFGGENRTSGQIAINSSTFGSIEASGDRDFFRVMLRAGDIYQFDLRGNSTSDGTLTVPLLFLRADSGIPQATDAEGSGEGSNARIADFTALVSGEYFLDVFASPGFTGSYTLQATLVTARTETTGTPGGETLLGSLANDFILGLGGDDRFAGFGGTDFLDGGTGRDVAVFSGARSNYSIIRDNGAIIVTDLRPELDARTSLLSVERAEFDGVLFSFSGFAEPGAARVANFNAANGWTTQDRFPRQTADVNGDGLADIVGFGQAGTLVALGQANGTFAAPILAIANYGVDQGWTSDNIFHRELADVNGDGRDDIVGFGTFGVLVSLAQANGTFAAPITGSTNFNPANGWTSQDRFARTVADVNGDGFADIIGFGTFGTLVALGTGTGSFGAANFALANFGANQGWTSNNQFHREVGDVNGDGRADVVGFGTFGTLVALGEANGAFGTATFALSNFGTNQGWSTQDVFARDLADVNGDGLADVVGFGIAGTFVANGQSDGSFSAAGFELANFGRNQGWSSDNIFHRELADVNGDGRADIVGFGQSGVLVGLAFDGQVI